MDLNLNIADIKILNRIKSNNKLTVKNKKIERLKLHIVPSYLFNLKYFKKMNKKNSISNNKINNLYKKTFLEIKNLDHVNLTIDNMIPKLDNNLEVKNSKKINKFEKNMEKLNKKVKIINISNNILLRPGLLNKGSEILKLKKNKSKAKNSKINISIRSSKNYFSPKFTKNSSNPSISILKSKNLNKKKKFKTKLNINCKEKELKKLKKNNITKRIYANPKIVKFINSNKNISILSKSTSKFKIKNKKKYKLYNNKNNFFKEYK